MLAVTDNLLRIVNFCFLVITIGLVSDLIATRTRHSSRVNYCMFTSAYGIFSDSLYGVFANFFEPLAWPLVLFTLDFLNFAFTFTAGTVLAVGIRAHSCNNQRYLDRETKIIQGSERRCREAQAAIAFYYFSMAIFLAKMIMSALNLFSNGAFGNKFIRRRRNAAEVGVPTVSQV
ncbi:Non-classical export protein 2 [Nakaseomyces bracarensis]|uniref:Non-classical export protein 2 n=1 Tax=Nakaseomyces bracarensis TaxID=273131 RepID=A0ABR4NTI6_9SACH